MLLPATIRAVFTRPDPKQQMVVILELVAPDGTVLDAGPPVVVELGSTASFGHVMVPVTVNATHSSAGPFAAPSPSAPTRPATPPSPSVSPANPRK